MLECISNLYFVLDKMTDFSNLTRKFRIQKDNVIDSASITKRPRQSLGCTQCRKAKLRCDRQQPCASCVQRDEAALCSYQWFRQDHLSHLESLVKDMMPPTTRPSAGAFTTSDHLAAEPGVPGSVPAQRMSIANYVDSTH